MKIVYHRHYNIGFFGLERLHPFDSRKYGRAWRCLQREFDTPRASLPGTPMNICTCMWRAGAGTETRRNAVNRSRWTAASS